MPTKTSVVVADLAGRRDDHELALREVQRRAICSTKGWAAFLHERVAAQGLLVDLDAQAGAARQVEPAVAGLDGPGEERRLLVAGRELDGQRAAERRGHVQGGGQPGPEVERVRRDRQVGGLGERGDLLELGDAAHLGDARLQDVAGALRARSRGSRARWTRSRRARSASRWRRPPARAPRSPPAATPALPARTGDRARAPAPSRWPRRASTGSWCRASAPRRGRPPRAAARTEATSVWWSLSIRKPWATKCRQAPATASGVS